MKHKLPKILRDIRGHRILPPPETFELVKRQLYDLEEAVNAKTFFKPLQNAEVEPPAGMFLKIMNKANVQKDAEKKSGAFFFTSFYRFATVAAVVVLIVGAWIGLRPTGSGKAALQSVTQKVLPAFTPMRQTASLLPGLAIKPGTVNLNTVNNKSGLKVAKQKVSRQEDYFTVANAGVNGCNFPVINNDLLFTLASFRNNKVYSFLTSNENDELMVNLTPYEDIVISSKMRKIFAGIFKTNSRGNPNRKTKKAKAKLEKWCRSDIVQFDDYLINNPLDPVELGDFIFKN